MYSSQFPIEFACKLWDNILYHGQFYIFKIALAIMECIGNKSEDIDDEEDDL